MKTRKTDTIKVPHDSAVFVTVTEANRLAAITSLSRAIESLAHALNEPTQVNVTGCTISNTTTGVTIKSA